VRNQKVRDKMHFIINNLLYNTEKMEKVADCQKWYAIDNGLLKAMYSEKKVGRVEDCELWRSSKGRYLLTHEKDYGKSVGEAIEEDEAKEILQHYNYSKYVELYGELPEA
jgi:hypothetical protein